MGNTHFQIQHYAGEVVYANYGMIEKNKDQLNKNLVEMLQETVQNAYIKALYPVQAKSFKKPPTVSTQFVAQMKTLMSNLSECNAHYVRTIKPNDQKKAGVYQKDMVKNQVTYLGLKENVVVRRAGYAVRNPYGRTSERGSEAGAGAKRAREQNERGSKTSASAGAMRVQMKGVRTRPRRAGPVRLSHKRVH